jgi:glycosyltransferase involved in cell wall biosynthesis
MSAASTIGAVVIGRNEGARLIRCLESLRDRVDRIVYVDSGSTDGSLDAAAARGVDVVALDMAEPFTAARARNAGVEALERSGPAPNYVQFVDGDCEIEPDWIAAARTHLDAASDAAAVCGRRRERFPDASVYNLLCDMEWNTPVGRANACGGDSLMRVEAFRAVGGFDPTLIAGEEPELCFRLRRAGWTVWRLDAPMTLHDAAMTRFGQWWRRAIRGGWAYAEGATLHGASAERYNRRALRSVLVWGLAAPAAIIATVVGAAAAPSLAVVSALGFAAYPAMALRIARGRQRAGDPWRAALLYGAFVMLGKIPQAIGALRYFRLRRTGGRARLIEYK